jgi:hypothetical protein
MINLLTKILFFALTAFFFASCSMTSRFSTVKSMEITGPGVIAQPVSAELDVNPSKVTASAEAKYVDDAKQRAMFEALKSSNSDVLVEPKFDIVTSGSSSNVTVTGYPAKYKNFKSMKFTDAELMSYSTANKVESNKVVTSNQPSKGRGKVLLYTLLGTGVFIWSLLMLVGVI